MSDRRRIGPVERALRQVIRELPEDGAAPGRAVFAAQALGLARVLDDGTAGLAVAAVNRELRELVKAMTATEVGDDGDPRTRIARDLAARLSAPLGNAAN